MLRILFLMVFVTFHLVQMVIPTSVHIASPNSTLLAFQNAEVGGIISFGIGGENEHMRHCPRHYVLPDINSFHPSDLDTDAWVQAAVSFGAKWITLTAQHSTGFSLFPSYDEVLARTGFEYKYGVEFASWGSGKRDIVAEFAQSCHKYGIGVGLYYALNTNAYLRVYGGKVQPESPSCPVCPGGCQKNVTQELYEAISAIQQEILWTRYGDLFEIWFDGGGREYVVSQSEKLQPNAVKFNGLGWNSVRWIGTETGLSRCEDIWSTTDKPMSSNHCGEYGGGFYAPVESDTTVSLLDRWFWEPSSKDFIRPDWRMREVYDATVGRNQNLLLNIAPSHNGTVIPEAMELYKHLGEYVSECYGNPVAQITGHFSGPSISLPIDHGKRVDRVSVKEDISKGQRVSEWELKVTTDLGREIRRKAHSIGHKRIVHLDEVVFDPKSIELTIQRGSGVPEAVILEMSAFCCGELCKL